MVENNSGGLVGLKNGVHGLLTLYLGKRLKLESRNEWGGYL